MGLGLGQVPGAGQGLNMPRGLKPYFQFVLPVLVLAILVMGLL